ncbi:MAG: aldehyde dehydrogenase family protein [Patescibacteria group bacterium]
MKYPETIPHWIYNERVYSFPVFTKNDPSTGKKLADVQRGNERTVNDAITSAEYAYEGWSRMTSVERGKIIRKAAELLEARKDEATGIVALECGKSLKSARGEVEATIECGRFISELGKDLGEYILQSGVPGRRVFYVRQSIGVGALITPFNNPLAGVAWKSFPALLCGNAVVLKAHEYAPYVPIWFATVLKDAGVPAGVFSVIQGFGNEVGLPLVHDQRVRFISFTGSSATAKRIRREAVERDAKMLAEGGGKNPFVVCDDADLDRAAELAVQSAFIDGGQRCAAASRIIVMDGVYDTFKNKFIELVRGLKVGTADSDNYGAIISEKRLVEIEQDIFGAVSRGAVVAVRGTNLYNLNDGVGYFLTPTVLEGVPENDPISHKEVFGPVAVLYRATTFDDAVRLANNSAYKLTGAVCTQDYKRQRAFENLYRAGVVRINGPTHGSESHMSFGGMGVSGDGWREPGRAALDFYADWKQVSYQ